MFARKLGSVVAGFVLFRSVLLADALPPGTGICPGICAENATAFSLEVCRTIPV